LKPTTKTMVATITGRCVKTKEKTNQIEVHERIQLTVGTKTCPVEGDENQLKPETDTPDTRTLNLFGGVLEAEAAK
jgi:hypothetical protein